MNSPVPSKSSYKKFFAPSLDSIQYTSWSYSHRSSKTISYSKMNTMRLPVKFSNTKANMRSRLNRRLPVMASTGGAPNNNNSTPTPATPTPAPAAPAVKNDNSESFDFSYLWPELGQQKGEGLEHWSDGCGA